ncbi:MAG TPA: FAD-dependent oxidoreductase [Acetobacteraceae bacterium]|nr:FAD-dependent oxidoreductase [Acetobacteraceae bacterium]
MLEAEGIAVRLHAECIRFDLRGDDVVVGADCTSGAPEISGSHVLLAVGRRPNTDDLGLDRAGMTVDARGFIVVDDQLRTNVDGIWAMGDCNGRGAFTHTAYNDFEIVAANLLDNDPRRVSDRIEAYALYTDPPPGRVGMTERAARAAGSATAKEWSSVDSSTSEVTNRLSRTLCDTRSERKPVHAGGWPVAGASPGLPVTAPPRRSRSSSASKEARQPALSAAMRSTCSSWLL